MWGCSVWCHVDGNGANASDGSWFSDVTACVQIRCFSLFQLYFHHSGPRNRHHQQKRASGNSKKVLLWTTNSGQFRPSSSFAEFKSMSFKSFMSFCFFFLPYFLQLSSVRPLWETHLPGVASVWTAAQGEAGGCRARWGCRLSNQPLVAAGKEKGHPGRFSITLYSHQHKALTKCILFKKKFKSINKLLFLWFSECLKRSIIFLYFCNVIQYACTHKFSIQICRECFQSLFWLQVWSGSSASLHSLISIKMLYWTLIFFFSI